jgi:hypothetical protein
MIIVSRTLAVKFRATERTVPSPGRLGLGAHGAEPEPLSLSIGARRRRAKPLHDHDAL